mmetsp:Transcript_40788/g.88353  ORF Transcript_40788/g.88353 Transcript_40788/m.88353 type:complete len:205 (-) Transcript_40788:62-676(-)
MAHLPASSGQRTAGAQQLSDLILPGKKRLMHQLTGSGQGFLHDSPLAGPIPPARPGRPSSPGRGPGRPGCPCPRAPPVDPPSRSAGSRAVRHAVRQPPPSLLPPPVATLAPWSPPRRPARPARPARRHRRRHLRCHRSHRDFFSFGRALECPACTPSHCFACLQAMRPRPSASGRAKMGEGPALAVASWEFQSSTCAPLEGYKV